MWAGRWAGIKPIRPAINTLNSTIWCRTDHFFHCDLSLKCLKRRLIENWLKQIGVRGSAAQSSCWMMLSSFGSVSDKKQFTLAATLKSSRNDRLSVSAASKNKDVGAKRRLGTERAGQTTCGSCMGYASVISVASYFLWNKPRTAATWPRHLYTFVVRKLHEHKPEWNIS